MFESEAMRGSSAALRGLTRSLSDLPAAVDDVERVERIRLLEELKCAAAAAQAVETAAFAASQHAVQVAAGVPVERAGRGIAGQVGLAKRQSPFHAARYVGWAKILTSELPGTFAALQAGEVTEWRAMIVARETGWLSREHRAAVDAALAPQLGQWGDRRVEAEAKTAAYRLDPHGYVARVRGAVSDRGVSLRPAPELMARLTGFLPVAQGVAAHAALARQADSLLSQGDPRSRRQIMADTLVERITGQTCAGDVPVEINLVMSDITLLGTSRSESEKGAAHAAREPAGADEPAQLIGYGPVPAEVARELVLGGSEATPRWLRRLFLEPGTGQLAAMDSRRRCFTSAQWHFLTLRDQVCRTPWCEAPIRHIDHVHPAETGGPTSVANGQGYCAACNYARQAPGWHAVTSPKGAGHEVVITTPTGHHYRSRPPTLPGIGRRTNPESPVERRLAELLHAA